MNTSQFSVSALTFPCWPSTFTTGLGIANNKARWFRRQSGIFLVFEWWRYCFTERWRCNCLAAWVEETLWCWYSQCLKDNSLHRKKVYLMFCCQNDSVHNTVEYKWSVYRMKITLSELWGPKEAVSLLIRWFMFMRENGNTVWNEFLPVHRLCICFVKKDSVNLTSRGKPILFISRVNYGLKLCCTQVDILHGFKSGQRSS